MSTGRRGNDYIDKKELLAEIVKSKKRMRESNVPLSPPEALTPRLVEMFRKIIDKYATNLNWRGYTYLEDMKSEAALALAQNALKFDETRFDNPFGYYTQIVKHCFISGKDREDKQRNIRDDLLEHTGMMPSYHRQEENEKRSTLGIETKKDIQRRAVEIEEAKERLTILDALTRKVVKLTIPDLALDTEISDLMELPVGAYTYDPDLARNVLPEGYTCTVTENAEIAGTRGTVVRVVASGVSMMRMIPEGKPTARVAIAITGLGLTAHRDILSKRIRDLTGEKAAVSSRFYQLADLSGRDVDHHRSPDLGHSDFGNKPWKSFGDVIESGD